MAVFSSALQLVALVLFLVGCVILGGVGGAFVGAAIDLVYVGVAINRSQ